VESPHKRGYELDTPNSSA